VSGKEGDDIKETIHKGERNPTLDACLFQTLDVTKIVSL
jgi:hypothetical protein